MTETALTQIEKCPLCDRAGEVVTQGQPSPQRIANEDPARIRHDIGTGLIAIDCPTCGRFETHENFIDDGLLAKRDVHSRRYLLSASTKNATGVLLVDQELIERLRKGQIVEKSVQEKIELVVRWYANQSKEIGDSVPMASNNCYPIGWCRSSNEWVRLVRRVGKELELFEPNEIPRGQVVMTLKGWQWLAERPKARGDIGFIAMAFDPSLKHLQSAIEQGVRWAGYSPLRIDQEDYVGGVMDKIIARIRDSRFVVADFKFNRGGVYYEAGFAAGLGIPVFCLCAQGQTDPQSEDRVHFDVAHLNILHWDRNNLAHLSERLRDRIKAVIGSGPRT